jgi:hypothetical protein
MLFYQSDINNTISKILLEKLLDDTPDPRPLKPKNPWIQQGDFVFYGDPPPPPPSGVGQALELINDYGIGFHPYDWFNNTNNQNTTQGEMHPAIQWLLGTVGTAEGPLLLRVLQGLAPIPLEWIPYLAALGVLVVGVGGAMYITAESGQIILNNLPGLQEVGSGNATAFQRIDAPVYNDSIYQNSGIDPLTGLPWNVIPPPPPSSSGNDSSSGDGIAVIP